jgi:hypothetical protein
VLSVIFGPTGQKVKRGYRKLHNVYSPPDIVRMIKSRRISWVGHVVRMSEKRNAYKVSVGIPERPLRRHRHRQDI